MFKYSILALILPPFLWGLADPMQPLDYDFFQRSKRTQESKEPQLSDQVDLQAIIVHGTKKMVIIAQQSFVEGDFYGQFQILSISLEKVSFEDSQSKTVFYKTVGYPMTKTSSLLR